MGDNESRHFGNDFNCLINLKPRALQGEALVQGREASYTLYLLTSARRNPLFVLPHQKSQIRRKTLKKR
jgi:hypothetical protein